MLSRRNFVRLGATAAGLPLLDRATALEAADEKPALPPSIASLKSMRDQAKPITNDERRARLEKARGLMGHHKLDAVMMIGGTSLLYFANLRWWNSERLGALLLPVKGEPFFVCPKFEEDRMREQLDRGPLGRSAEVLTWEEDGDPYRVVALGLKDRGLATGTLGMEETLRFVFSDGVAKAAPAMTIASATPVTAGCRQVKDAHELELMKLANHVTLKAYEAAWRALQPGMTEREFESLVSAAHSRLGFNGGASVQVGEYSALPHGSIQPQVIREQTVLLMDGGCEVEGYKSDISRSLVLGKPSDKMKSVFEIVQRAQKEALAAAHPGVQCQAVDAAARKVITDAGYGPGYKFFTHRLGHGIGMDGHEWPYLVRGNILPLASGMTFSDEPGIYIRGEFGIRLEDDMAITANGAELLTPPSPSVTQPFG